MTQLKIGMIVHYFTIDQICRPAIVVGAFNELVNHLAIFHEDRIEFKFEPDMDLEQRATGTWHWATHPEDKPLPVVRRRVTSANSVFWKALRGK